MPNIAFFYVLSVITSTIFKTMLKVLTFYRIPKGALTANCELELQELMKQIDKLVAGKKKEWDREKEALQSRLGIREKECLMQKSTLEHKHKEVWLNYLEFHFEYPGNIIVANYANFLL